MMGALRLFALSAAAAAAIATSAAAAPFAASYRKDRWLPQYIEFNVPEPLDGGRLHIVGVAASSGRPGAVTLNGSLVNVSVGVPLPASWPVDWLRVEPATGLVAGRPFFVALHSRSPAWDAALAGAAPVPLSIADADSPGGAALASGSFVVAAAPVAATWVTTARARANVHIFLRNSGRAPATAARAVFSGYDVTGALPPAALTLAAGATALWVLPAAAVGGVAAVAEGAVWTLTGEWAGGALPATAAGGLLFREFFPVETWYHGSDCPFPGINDTAYALHRAHGIDTFFAEYTFDKACNTKLTSADLVNTIAPQHGFYVLPSFENGGLKYEAVTNQSALAGIFLADEDDTVVDDKARSLLAAVMRARVALPAQPTYAGGASNRYTGAFAGITDIKGMDAYIGACAPHYALLAMPARGSFDYLANTRANHEPGPTWLYSQGLEEGWDGSLLKTNRQANAAEIAVQVASVAAAGAKGLMLFETELKYLVDPISAPTWATLGTLLRETGALRELYRAGDATGAAAPLDAAGASMAATVLAEAVLHPRGAVVLAINTAAVNDTYNDICCALDVVACHFTFVPSAVASLAVTLPAGFAVADAFEVFNATVLPGSPAIQSPFPNATLALTGVALGTEGPGSAACGAPAQAIVRTFVLAFDTALRGEVAAALAGGPPATTVAAAAAAAAAIAAAPAPHQVAVWRTARDTGDRLARVANLTFSPNPSSSAPSADASVFIDPTARFQEVFGFGGAITESATHVFGQLAPADQAALLDDLFGENAEGTSLRYTTGRLTIGSCDFALGYYSYNSMVNDTAMTNFTIAHDEAAIIPLVLRAQRAAAAQGRALRFISTPWSPPGWMKSNFPLNNDSETAMSCFPLGPLDCAIETWAYPAYSLYLSKYLSAYAAAGVSIFGITVQNEPQPQTGTLTYEGVWFPFAAEAAFVAGHLGPQLARDHPDTRIFIFDHNMGDEMLLYAVPILSDANASQYVDGVAFHWYDGPNWGAVADLHSLFPNVMYLGTEATVAMGSRGEPWWMPNTTAGSAWWANGEFYGTYILNDLLSWASGFIDWNILLDQNGAPDHGDPTGELCEGIIPCGSAAMLIADVTASPPTVHKQAFYYYVGHLSRFVPPGSVRIGATWAAGDSANLTAAAFATPSNSTVLVVMNALDEARTLRLADARFGALEATIAAHSIETWEW